MRGVTHSGVAVRAVLLLRLLLFGPLFCRCNGQVLMAGCNQAPRFFHHARSPDHRDYGRFFRGCLQSEMSYLCSPFPNSPTVQAPQRGSREQSAADS